MDDLQKKKRYPRFSLERLTRGQIGKGKNRTMSREGRNGTTIERVSVGAASNPKLNRKTATQKLAGFEAYQKRDSSGSPSPSESTGDGGPVVEKEASPPAAGDETTGDAEKEKGAAEKEKGAAEDAKPPAVVSSGTDGGGPPAPPDDDSTTSSSASVGLPKKKKKKKRESDKESPDATTSTTEPIPKKKKGDNNEPARQEHNQHGGPTVQRRYSSPNAPARDHDTDEDSFEGQQADRSLTVVNAVSRVKPPRYWYVTSIRTCSAGYSLANVLNNFWFPDANVGGGSGQLMGLINTTYNRLRSDKEAISHVLSTMNNMITRVLSPLYQWIKLTAPYDVGKMQAALPVVALTNRKKFDGFAVLGPWMYPQDKGRGQAVPITDENLKKAHYYFDSLDGPKVGDSIEHYAVVINHEWVRAMAYKESHDKKYATGNPDPHVYVIDQGGQSNNNNGPNPPTDNRDSRGGWGNHAKQGGRR